MYFFNVVKIVEIMWGLLGWFGLILSVSVNNELGFIEFKVFVNFYGYLKFKSGM